MGQRSRKRRKEAGASAPVRDRPAMQRGYARSEARNEEVRRSLEPLAPGERPTAVTIAAIVAAVLLALDQLCALVTGLLGLSALISLTIVVPFGRAYSRDMQRLLAGEHWARWRYDGDEWTRFADQEWARARREARFGIPASMILAAAVGIFLAIIGGGQ